MSDTPRTDLTFRECSCFAETALTEMKEHARTLERELAKAVAALEFIRDAGGTTSDDAEYGQINYNGSWCAEQARAALYSIANKWSSVPPPVAGGG